MTLLVLKAWLATMAIMSVACACRWKGIDGPVIPGAAILILCGAVRYAL